MKILSKKILEKRASKYLDKENKLNKLLLKLYFELNWVNLIFYEMKPNFSFLILVAINQNYSIQN